MRVPSVCLLFNLVWLEILSNDSNIFFIVSNGNGSEFVGS